MVLWYEEKPHENDFTLVGRGARSRASNSPASPPGKICAKRCDKIRSVIGPIFTRKHFEGIVNRLLDLQERWTSRLRL
jgi:hypothetical protein